MKEHFFEKKCRYSIRKLAFGACSVMIGASCFTGTVLADSTESLGDKDKTIQPAEEAVIISDKEESMPAPVLAPKSNSEVVESVQSNQPVSEVPDATPTTMDSQKESVRVEDVPKNEEAVLRPKEIKFDSWDDLLKWEPGARADDDINKSSVPLAPRYQGDVVNEKANPDAKVQALSNTNSKAKDHASVGGEEFKSYAFDYWQYLDSMVFWEGLVPTPDVIDAGHRNGVPVYGTLFFNWSNSIADQERFVEALKQDEDGSFPIAKKLVDLAKYYGFDGYFINQETTGDLVKPLGKKMRDFMLYSKEYAEKVQHPIKYSWYDAMTYEYGRYHEDGLGEYNYPFMQKQGDKVPADNFFANFNWNKEKNDYSITTAKWLGRSQFDVLAGLELQKGGSYHTKVDWKSLLDENGKLRLSLGLFAPDTITSLGKTGEDYHKNEDIFFTGYQGDPTGQKPADKDWYGIANLVADRTAAVGKTFSTSFNTGHGRKWFVDGEVSKDSEWNYRSVAGILPTWRWWQSSSAEKLKAGYDFEDAYNGGNSLKFSGDVSQATNQDVKLYSTKIEVTDHSKIKVAHKGGKGSKVFLALATNPKYKFDDADAWMTLTPSDSWKNEEFDLSALAGKTIYGMKLYFQHDHAIKDYQFNLGQLSISDHQELPPAPQNVTVKRQVLKNAQEAEAVLQFKESADADYYEVYQQDQGRWQLLTGSSNSTIYLPKITRSADSSGQTQALKVVAVGKNGQRSEAGMVNFDWGLNVSDTTVPRALAPNIVLGAQVIGSTFADKDGGEGIEGMLNGTITSLSDKWSSDQLRGSVDIRLTQPRRVIRWVMDHAGAGGESVNDGLMNTKDFDLYYKDRSGEWKLAKSVRGNKAHVSDITLDQPITAQDWRLDIVTSDNGTPWRAIRIYNWKMYESLDTESENIPMAHVAARSLGNQTVQLGFKDVPKDAQVMIYDSAQAKQPLATLTASKSGDLASLPLKFDRLPSLLYYRTMLPGKELSNRLAVHIPQEDKKIAKVVIESLPSKKIYREGDELALKGGLLRVQYEGDHADEVVQFTNTAVSISGFDTAKIGEQDLQISYLGLPVESKWPVYVARHSEAGEKKIIGIEIRKMPQTQYTVGDKLDISEGVFDLIFDDESQESHPFSDGVIQGYDPQKAGRQTLTLAYQGHQISFDILLSPKAAINDEYLKQTISKVESSLADLPYRFASQEKQAKVQEQLTRSKSILENHSATQEEVNQALQDLTQVLSELDGQSNYQEAVKSLEELRKEAETRLEKVLDEHLSRLVEEAKVLIENQTATPVDFETLEKALRSKLEEKIEEHVGSLEKGEEVGALSESLPKLIIEDVEETVKQERRVNPELAVGETRLIQKGESGLKRHFIVEDATGKRSLIQVEEVRPMVVEIIEVGSKITGTSIPQEGVKEWIARKPSLEVEEGLLAFTREERVNPHLPAGQVRIIQAGVPGKERRLIEVDAQGTRRLVQTEVLLAPINEIVEVGSASAETTIHQQDPQIVSDKQKSEETSKELPNTGTKNNALLTFGSLLALILSSSAFWGRKKDR